MKNMHSCASWLAGCAERMNRRCTSIITAPTITDNCNHGGLHLFRGNHKIVVSGILVLLTILKYLVMLYCLCGKRIAACLPMRLAVILQADNTEGISHYP
jgi:hypothetical protein